jgi:DNA polymerase III sliding clamp (beta) subunit (PCNA family)
MSAKGGEKMEIRVTKLQEAVDLVKPAVPKKPTLKVASYLRLGEGKVIATDLETMIIANLLEAKEPMLLPYFSIAETLKYIPGSNTLKVELKGKMIFLSWNGGSASYPTEDVADYPVLPEMTARAEGLVDGDTLIAAMVAALPYVATDTTRPVLSGITLVLGTPIEIAAGDGFRMSHQVLGLSFPLEEKIIIPAHAVAILSHVFWKTPRTPPPTAGSLVQVVTAKRQLRMSVIGDNKLRLDFGTSASVVMNLIMGKPPEWLALIPKGEPILQSQLFAPQLEAAVKRVRDIARDGSGIVRMEFADGKLKVSARGEDQEISSTIDTILTHWEPGRTAINQSYLLDFVSGKQGIVSVSKYTDVGPVVFEYQKSHRVLIMPMAVQWSDEKPPTVKEEPEAAIAESVDAADEPDDDSNMDESKSPVDEETAENEPAEAEQEIVPPEPDSKEPVIVAEQPSAKKRRKKKTVEQETAKGTVTQ